MFYVKNAMMNLFAQGVRVFEKRVGSMYLKGLDELERKMLDLLTQNARYTYSELGERLGLSRVAIKNRMDALEERGIIEGYTVIVNPQQLGCLLYTSPSPRDS